MRKEELLTIVCNSLSMRYCEEYEYSVRRILRNNDTYSYRIDVLRKGSDIAKSIDGEMIEQLYKKYNDLEKVGDILYSEIIASGGTDKVRKCLKGFSDYSHIKDKVIYRLVNFEKNTLYLEGRPYIKFNDLAIIFVVLVDNSDSMKSIGITNMLMETWNVTVYDLLADATVNTQKLLPLSLRSMQAVLAESLGVEFNNEEVFDNSMLVLSNEDGMYGAAAILYQGALRAAAIKLNTDKVIILPSSVNEVILIDGNTCLDQDVYSEMITEINTNEVSAEEVLSNRPYIYDVNTDKVCIYEN